VGAISETAYAKINLALHVRARLPNGYHEIETLFAFCEDGDVLSADVADDLRLSISGPFSSGLSTGSDNLVLRAAQALQEAHGVTVGAHIALDKRLPVAAGIGGGSADAAAALHLLTQLWDLPDDLDRLIDIARPLGADVPACVVSQTVRGEGVGDQLTLMDNGALAGAAILLVNPLMACPTGPVFAGWDGQDDGPLSGDTALAITLESRNVLEASAKALVGEIGAVLSSLTKCEGLQVARMSGSGATCFGLFESEIARDKAAASMQSDWWSLPTRLR
jgi:4-diphosphocytidyl-2-C-methyl-D-erythritol kinase